MKCHTRIHLFLWTVLLPTVCCNLLYSNPAYSQFNKREKVYAQYVPYNNKSLTDFPLVTIKVVVHVVQRSAENPENFQDTPEDRAAIKTIIERCNVTYSKLQEPTLKVEPTPPLVHDSRIRFRLDEIRFHQDSVGWDRNKRVIVNAGKWPMQIDSVNLEKNELIFFNQDAWRGFYSCDSLKVTTANTPQVLHKRNVKKDGSMTILTVKENLSSLAPIRATYFKKVDFNCSADNWKNLANSDDHHLHLFLTGASSKRIQFGCAPSPYYLNVSNFIFGGPWAGYKLVAHEIGHTLGLGHTFGGGYSDLPTRDRKCSGCNCDTIDVSNNLMGYNKCRNYLSPLQIGHIYMNYTAVPKYIRITTACDYDPEKTIVVRRDESWSRSRALQGDLVIKKKTTLTLTADQFLSSGSTIYVERKAKLVVDGCIVKNGCGDLWNGVVFCKKYRPSKIRKSGLNSGKVECINMGKIEGSRDDG